MGILVIGLFGIIIIVLIVVIVLSFVGSKTDSNVKETPMIKPKYKNKK